MWREIPVVNSQASKRKHLRNAQLSSVFTWYQCHFRSPTWHLRYEGKTRILTFCYEICQCTAPDCPHTAKRHTHTVIRTPNGGDYGHVILRLWRQESSERGRGIGVVWS